MSFRGISRLLGCLGAAAVVWLALPTAAQAQIFGTPTCAPCHEHCPPFVHVRVPGPPRLCWKHACPKPLCNPCDLPHWGFYETCWHPWPFPPDWTHCHSVPPAATVVLDPLVNPNLPGKGLPGVMPQPVPSIPTPTPGARMPNSGITIEPLPLDGDVPIQLPQPRRLEQKGPGQRN